jgi:chromate transporter
MEPLSLARMTALFTRVGNLTFGGGDPTMAALQAELIASRGWLSREQYGLIYGLARVIPGTNLLAFCAGAGWRMLGWPGAVGAVMGVAAPSAFLVVMFTHWYQALRANPLAMAAVEGTLAAAAGMMAAAVWQLLRPHLKRGRWVRASILYAASLALSFGLGVSPVPLLAGAFAAGLVWEQ